MSLEDKVKNAAEDLGGKAKEAAGKVSGNKDVEAEGKMDQAASTIKDKASELGEKAKDVAEDIGSNVKAAAEKVKDSLN